MTAMTRRTCLALSALAPIAVGALTQPSRSDDNVSSREVLRDRYFPNLVLTTHEGRSVRFYDDLIKDKIVTLNFFYTQCEDGRCPMATANLVRVQKLGFAGANPIRDARKASHTGTLRYGNEPLQLWSACPALSKPEWIVESMSWLDGPKEPRVS